MWSGTLGEEFIWLGERFILSGDPNNGLFACWRFSLNFYLVRGTEIERFFPDSSALRRGDGSSDNRSALTSPDSLSGMGCSAELSATKLRFITTGTCGCTEASRMNNFRLLLSICSRSCKPCSRLNILSSLRCLLIVGSLNWLLKRLLAVRSISLWNFF